MKWFRNMKIGTKLISGFVIVSAFIFIAGILGIVNVKKVGSAGDRILDEHVPIADCAMESMIALISARDNLGEYLLATELSKLPELEDEFRQLMADFDLYTDAIINGSNTEQLKVIPTQNQLLIDKIGEAQELHAKMEKEAYELMEHHALALTEQNIHLSLNEIEARTHMQAVDETSELTDLKLDEIEALADDSMNAAMVVADNAQSSATIMLIVTSIVGFIVGVVLGFVISRMITQPTNRIVAMIKDIAQGEGDLTKRLVADSKDEIGKLAEWFNTFMDKLHDIIAQVASNTEQLASASNEISSSSEQLSSGVKEQTNQTTQVSAAIEEMAATIIENSKNTNAAAEKANEASSKSQEGSRLAEETSRGMDDIVQASNVTAKNIEGLAEKATAIGEIIKVIDDIADQTNLLALNAAIEAARAGEQGRGFAVVADEVRKLAERTTKATKEVADTIKGIQSDVSTANAQIVESQDYVNKGKERVDGTNASLNEIFGSIEAVQEMIRQVAAASEEQSSAAEQISKNVENVTRITQETAAGAQQSASAAEQLNRQAEDLQKLVGGFKLRKEQSLQSQV
jgi:methyl-accepting chemotaxis protein